jgi:hypothetical protein
MLKPPTKPRPRSEVDPAVQNENFKKWMQRKDKYDKAIRLLGQIAQERAEDQESWAATALSLCATDCQLNLGKIRVESLPYNKQYRSLIGKPAHDPTAQDEQPADKDGVSPPPLLPLPPIPCLQSAFYDQIIFLATCPFFCPPPPNKHTCACASRNINLWNLLRLPSKIGL